MEKQKVIVTTDLVFGDSGKGSIVDYLTHKTNAHTVIRYNGGAQAAHNVITPDGRHHTFSQFGSGTFVGNTETFLSKYMMVHPHGLLNEAKHLVSLGVTDTLERMSIDRRALIISPYQQATNCLKEIYRGSQRHGSCGVGIGETMSDSLSHPNEVLRAGDLEDQVTTRKKLFWLRDQKSHQIKEILHNLSKNPDAQKEIGLFNDPDAIDYFVSSYKNFSEKVKVVDENYFETLLKQPGTIIFEGAQGLLLDELYGFYPYNSWSNLTIQNADEMISKQNYDGEVIKLGLIRGYLTRHGAGPFVTEDVKLTEVLQDTHNKNNPWQHEFRVGYLDLLTIKYALSAVGKIDGLVITCLDLMNKIKDWKVCDRYSHTGTMSVNNLDRFFDHRGKEILSILLPKDKDAKNLSLMTKRTDTLMKCNPLYGMTFPGVESDISGYAEWVSELLNVPLAITSSGPTANEKIDYTFTKDKILAEV